MEDSKMSEEIKKATEQPQQIQQPKQPQQIVELQLAETEFNMEELKIIYSVIASAKISLNDPMFKKFISIHQKIQRKVQQAMPQVLPTSNTK